MALSRARSFQYVRISSRVFLDTSTPRRPGVAHCSRRVILRQKQRATRFVRTALHGPLIHRPVVAGARRSVPGTGYAEGEQIKTIRSILPKRRPVPVDAGAVSGMTGAVARASTARPTHSFLNTTAGSVRDAARAGI